MQHSHHHYVFHLCLPSLSLSLSLLGSVDEFLLSTKEEIKNRCVVTMLPIIFENEVMMMLLMLLMMTPS